MGRGMPVPSTDPSSHQPTPLRLKIAPPSSPEVFGSIATDAALFDAQPADRSAAQTAARRRMSFWGAPRPSHPYPYTPARHHAPRVVDHASNLCPIRRWALGPRAAGRSWIRDYLGCQIQERAWARAAGPRGCVLIALAHPDVSASQLGLWRGALCIRNRILVECVISLAHLLTA